MDTVALAEGIEHGTPEGYQAGCRKEKTCPALYTHGMCCLYAHVRSTTDVRYFKAKARDPRPAAIAAALGIKSPEPAVVVVEAAVDDEFASKPPGYHYRTRHRAPAAPTPAEPPAPTHPKEPAMPTPADVAAATTPKPRAKKTPPTPAPASGRTKTEIHAIREWAQAQGLPIGTAGRIPKRILDAYDTAHPEDAARPLAESSHDSAPQEDAGAPVIEREAPTAPSEPAAEDEEMGHPQLTETEIEADKNAAEARAALAAANDDAIAIEEALAEGADIIQATILSEGRVVGQLALEAALTGNDYNDVLDEARDRAHAPTPAELAEIFGVPVDAVVPHTTYENAQQRADGLKRELTEQLYAEAHPEQPRPEWADVAIAEDVEKARNIAVRLEQELAQAEAERDTARAALDLTLQKWATEREKAGALRLRLDIAHLEAERAWNTADLLAEHLSTADKQLATLVDIVERYQRADDNKRGLWGRIFG